MALLPQPAWFHALRAGDAASLYLYLCIYILSRGGVSLSLSLCISISPWLAAQVAQPRRLAAVHSASPCRHPHVRHLLLQKARRAASTVASVCRRVVATPSAGLGFFRFFFFLLVCYCPLVAAALVTLIQVLPKISVLLLVR